MLRKWFGRGMYPTAEQFSDVFDSFWHKTEDEISMDKVGGLTDRLNGKYPAADGERLEEQVMKVEKKLTDYIGQTDEAIDQLREQLSNLQSVVENDCVQRTTRVILRGGSPADLANENNK
jgi:hypothetical protein